MHKYTDHAMWYTVAIGHIADPILVKKQTDKYELWVFDKNDRHKATIHTHTQTDRVTIIRVSSIAVGRTRHKRRTDTQSTQHAAVSDIVVRRNTAADSSGRIRPQ